jgi:toxin ParE1/3/4
MSDLAISRTSRSEEDLIAIWRYIARDSEEAATRTLLEIDNKIELLARHPMLGERVPAFHRPLRQLIVGSYVVIYQILPDAIQVVRIFHASQQWEELL